MPKIDNHPLRLMRIRAGIGQKELADAIGVHRSTIFAIEEARTVTPEPETLAAIADYLRVPVATLEADIERWRRERAANGPALTPVARATLELPASAVATLGSFEVWRARIAPNPTAFATLLGLNRAVAANYERGIRERGMPEGLSHALVTVLGIDNDYLLALQRLPPTND